jgi:CDP-4-dehydro-6-deoxyglucose reductase, E3
VRSVQAVQAREDVPFTVVAHQLRTPVVVELELRPTGPRIDFQPGQYVLVSDVGYERTPRSYSIANAPRSDGTVTLLVTRIPDGELSSWLHQIETGCQLLLSGPYGSFVADPDASDPVLYLAAGSGLAPVRALIEAGLARRRHPPMTLLFSARTPADLIDNEQLERWDADDPEFRYLRTLTRAAEPPPTGRIPAILAGLLPRLERHRVYIAGDSGFVAACADAAHRHGAAPELLFSEEFFVQPQPWGTARVESESSPSTPGTFMAGRDDA